MTKLLVCVDSSDYANNVLEHAAWAAKRLDAEVDLLHVLRRHSDYNAPSSDHTGAIGLGAKSSLLETLTEVDQERAELDQKRGRTILQEAEESLRRAEVEKVSTIHRRGCLSDTIKEFEDTADIIFIGKRGEQANPDSTFLGSNVEKVARAVHKPLFLVSRVMRPVETFVIAYDGRDNAHKAVDFACTSKLLQGLECHFLTVGQEPSTEATDAIAKLQKAGYAVIQKNEKGSHVDEVIASYTKENGVDVLLAGAYSHSRVRSMFLGSTTAKLIQSCDIPVMLFR